MERLSWCRLCAVAYVGCIEDVNYEFVDEAGEQTEFDEDNKLVDAGEQKVW
jgi:hypothetical protein